MWRHGVQQPHHDVHRLGDGRGLPAPAGDYGDRWEAAFRNRFQKEMIEKFDTHFFVGTVHQYPGSWIIVGLFYPPKPKPDLFAQ